MVGNEMSEALSRGAGGWAALALNEEKESNSRSRFSDILRSVLSFSDAPFGMTRLGRILSSPLRDGGSSARQGGEDVNYALNGIPRRFQFGHDDSIRPRFNFPLLAHLSSTPITDLFFLPSCVLPISSSVVLRFAAEPQEIAFFSFFCR
jgi:hypothetical protein